MEKKRISSGQLKNTIRCPGKWVDHAGLTLGHKEGPDIKSRVSRYIWSILPCELRVIVTNSLSDGLLTMGAISCTV